VQADSTAEEAKKLEGTWTITSGTYKGGTIDTAKGGQYVFANGTLTTTNNAGGAPKKFNFKIDPSKTPKTMDLAYVDGPQNASVGPVIYELDGDNLKLAFGSKMRPTEFTDTTQALYVLKRKK